MIPLRDSDTYRGSRWHHARLAAIETSRRVALPLVGRRNEADVDVSRNGQRAARFTDAGTGIIRGLTKHGEPGLVGQDLLKQTQLIEKRELRIQRIRVERGP